jgi:hypothetical protein
MFVGFGGDDQRLSCTTVYSFWQVVNAWENGGGLRLDANPDRGLLLVLHLFWTMML